MRHVRALLLILATGCYTQPLNPLYTLNPREQCAQTTMVLDISSGNGSGENGGLFGASQSAPGNNGGLYGTSQAVAPGENGGLYGASQSATPGENGGLYGASTRSSGQDVRCRRPTTMADQCEIRSLQASAELKHKSNAGEVAPVSNDQVEYARSSTYQSCMASVPPQPQ